MENKPQNFSDTFNDLLDKEIPVSSLAVVTLYGAGAATLIALPVAAVLPIIAVALPVTLAMELSNERPQQPRTDRLGPQ